MRASSSKASVISASSRCGKGYQKGQASAPEKVACSVSPMRREARAQCFSCSTAQSCRTCRLPRTCGGQSPSIQAS